MVLNRKLRAAAGRQTASILEARGYDVDGRRVDLGAMIDTACAGTESYPPQRAIPAPTTGGYDTRVEVDTESTLQAARRLAETGHPVALNFASAKNPGGGFLSGSRAQEESLAMCSGLYACLRDDDMYRHHRALRDPMYTAYAIYSPDVPVFRSDDAELLAEPWSCAFITAPAPNAKAVLARAPHRRDEVAEQMQLRIDRVLAIAAHHGHRELVLGAWGCGVFGNDCDQVASLFGAALSGRFAGVFEHIVFAVLDSSPEERFIGPFRRLATNVR